MASAPPPTCPAGLHTIHTTGTHCRPRRPARRCLRSYPRCSSRQRPQLHNFLSLFLCISHLLPLLSFFLLSLFIFPSLFFRVFKLLSLLLQLPLSHPSFLLFLISLLFPFRLHFSVPFLLPLIIVSIHFLVYFFRPIFTFFFISILNIFLPLLHIQFQFLVNLY